MKWKAGEYFPWKGILFCVTKVEHAKLVLEPIEMTAAMFKKRTKTKGGRWS